MNLVLFSAKASAMAKLRPLIYQMVQLFLFAYFFDLGSWRYSCNLIPACSFLHVLYGGLSIIILLSVPIPGAQRIADRVHLLLAFCSQMGSNLQR